MKQEIMGSLKAKFEAQFQAMEQRLSSQTIRETGADVSQGGRRSSCASAPDEASPIDRLTAPAKCSMQIKFATMNFSMDAAFGRVFPSPPGNEFISISNSCKVFCTLTGF